MKRLFCSVFVTLLFSLTALAQNEGINFQGVARNTAGEVLVSQKINLRLSILLGSETGTVAYVETRQVTTNPQGVFAVVLGDDKALTKSTNFSTINWTPSPKFIKVEMDPNAGSSYLVMGTSRLQAVPFAFYANGVDANNVKGVLPVSSGGTGVVSISDLKTSLGLDQVNNAALDTKVDKVAGKELSTNDYTTAEKTKLAAITGTNTGDQDLSGYSTTAQLATKANTVDVTTSLATKANTADVTASLATKANTADVTTSLATKANASDVTTSLATKVDKVTGKELSTNDYTTAEKTKLAAITGTNTGDQDLSGYATTAQLAAKANASDVTTSLAAKEDVSNKSNAALGTSTTLFPTQNAVKTYVDAQVLSATIADANASTKGKLQLAGDLAGTAASPSVVKLRGTPISSVAPTTAGQVLTYDANGSASWAAAASSGIPYMGATQAVDLGAFDMKVNGITIGRGKENIASNTAIGKDALLSNNAFGNENTAIGNLALSSNTSGRLNTAIGSVSLNSNISGMQNTAVGSNSLEKNVGVSYNTAVGSEALRYTVSGESNTATGASALRANISGAYNSAFGRNALSLSTANFNNAAFGTEALAANRANANSAFGAYALQINTTGYGNTAVGIGAMKFHTTGNDNVAIGVNAGLFQSNQTTGSNNTAIGAFAEYGSANLTNATVIGSGAVVTASNSIRLGNTSVGTIGGQVGWTAASDSRIKKNIVNSTYGLATVLQLRPVEYNLISNDLKQVGFIAQEVQKLVPEVVTGKEGDLSKGEILGITYANLVPVLTKAIQEQQKQIEDQNAKIAAQQKQIEELIKLVKGQ
jgi:hypothetical protein